MRIFLGNWQIIALDFFLCKAFEMSKAFQIQKAFKNKAFKMSILLGAILRTCERNRHLEDSQRRQGLRRRRAESENPSKHYDLLDPLDLDLSFETSKDWSEDDEEVNNQFFFLHESRVLFSLG